MKHEIKPGKGIEWMLLGVGTLIAIGGVALAWVFFRFGERGPEADTSVRKLMGVFYDPASKKWGWDEAYDAAVVKPVVEGSRKGLSPFDKNIVDGAVTGLARSVRGLAGVLRGAQTGIVQTYAAAIVLGVVVVVALMLFV